MFARSLFVLLFVPVTQQVLQGQSRAVVLPEDRCYLEFERLLDRPVDLELFDTPLIDVVEYIEAASGIPCELDMTSLEAAGLGSDTPITGEYRGMRLRDGLRLVLDGHMTWTFKSHMLIITTPEGAERNLISKVYDARRVVRGGWIPDYWAKAPGSVEVPYVYVYDFDSLTELIGRSIAPMTWDAVGGPGSIAGFDGRLGPALVVSQTYEVHEQIDRLLRKLERFGGAPNRPLSSRRRMVLHQRQFSPRPANPSVWRASNIRSSRLRSTGW